MEQYGVVADMEMIQKQTSYVLERELSFWNQSLNQFGTQKESHQIFDLLDELWFGSNAAQDFQLVRHRNSNSIGSQNYVTPSFSQLDTSDNSPESDLDIKAPKSPKHLIHGPFANPTHRSPANTIVQYRTSIESSQNSWKQRQWCFPNKQQQNVDQNLNSFYKSAPRPVPNAGGCQPIKEAEEGVEVSEEKIMEAAWKWRFVCKWGEEQRKTYCQQRGDSGASDEWHLALRRIDDNHNLQFGNLGVSGTISNKLTAESFGSELLGKESVTPEMQGDMKLSCEQTSCTNSDSTYDLKNIYSKAKTLAAERDRIEEEADRKWNLVSNNHSTWAGQHLEMVQIEQGKNQNVILYEISDPLTERSKLIVYGLAEDVQFEKLDEKFREKVEKIVTELEVQQPAVEILGFRKVLWDTQGKKIEIGSFSQCEQASMQCTAHPDEALQWMIKLLSQNLPSGVPLQVAK